MNYKILIVDDEPANVRILERLFRRQHNVITAESGEEALELLSLHDVALIISDQRMPVMTGIDFLKRAAEMRPQAVRIILTGYSDANALVEAINSGIVYKYVAKPWVNEDLMQTVQRALQHYETIKNQHQLKLEHERLKERLKTTLEIVVRTISEMLDLKDPHSHGHSRRIRSYAAAVGEHLNLDADELEQLSLAAFLHEAAHIGIPNYILCKQAPLTDEEHWIAKQNLERGLKLVESVPDLEDIASVLRYQHENWNGSGYPNGLGGEQIPLHSRIIVVADAYDELTFPRSLQAGLTHEEAIGRLRLDAGTKFDPAIVEAFAGLNSTAHIRSIVTKGNTGFYIENNSLPI
jgi:putative two-component system response regulator